MQAGKPKQQGGWQRGWWLVITIHALLLPLYGPLLDRHFAERLPYHNHRFLTAKVEHQHVYDHPHTHEPASHSEVDEAAGVLLIPPQELASQNALLLSLFSGTWANSLAQPPLLLHLIGLVSGELWPVKTIFLARPEEPPRL